MNRGALKSNKPRGVLFVLGSGVSSGICPNVEDLTKTVLNPDPKWFGYDMDEEFEAIVGFLNVLSDHAKPTTGICTYEDLFSMCEQLAKWELNIIQDPALRLFRNQIYVESKKHWSFYQPAEKSYFQEKPLAAIAKKAQRAIHVVIHNALIDKTEPRRQLNLLAETIHSLGSQNVDILTLNHDCLVEALFDREGILWTDGFDTEFSKDGDLVNFDAQAFRVKSRIRIIKLHGGCDWVYAGTNKDTFRWVKNPTDTDVDMCQDGRGEKFSDHPEEASTLTGTTTKAVAYTEGIHSELYLEARRLLSEYEHIICSGYGWNDYAFNTMLREWARFHNWHEDQRRFPRLLLLHSGDHLGEFRHTNNSQRLKKNLWFWPESWEKNLSEPWKPDHLDWMRCHPQWLSCTRLEDISNLFADRA